MTPTVDEVVLSPCPFCGTTPARLAGKSDGFAVCVDPAMRCPVAGQHIRIDRWNTRPSVTEGDDLKHLVRWITSGYMELNDLCDEWMALPPEEAKHALIMLRPIPQTLRLRADLRAIAAQPVDKYRLRPAVSAMLTPEAAISDAADKVGREK